MDGRRNLSGRPRHSHFRGALGSRRRWSSSNRSSAGKRRAARRSTYANEHDAPDYAADPKGERVPLDAPTSASPIRARPRPSANRILRRGYNYSRGVTNAGQLDMGLLFVCFQSDLAAGFLTVQSRLNGEQLEEYIKPVGGGYFFVLPGVQSKDDFFAEGLLRAAA